MAASETKPGANDFIRFADRDSDHPLIEKVWSCRSERADTFLSVAAVNFEMVITCLAGRRSITLRGPETKATSMDCPAEGEWLGIRFRPGTLVPQFLPGALRDHRDVTLPEASGRSFWMDGSAIEYPAFEQAEAFVARLAARGLLRRDQVAVDALLRRPRELSLRTAQRRFLRSTGVTYAAFRQIERARNATNLLREGAAILDVVSQLGYFDQSHLHRSLRRFIGETPARIVERRKQLSFLYKTGEAGRT